MRPNIFLPSEITAHIVDETFLGEWVKEKRSYQYYNNYISRGLITIENSELIMLHTFFPLL
jgi:hypothetical protein